MVKSRIYSSLFVAVVAVAANGTASASSYYHYDGSERGVYAYPDHGVSTKKRAQVYEELIAAKKNGLLSVPDSAYPNFQLQRQGPGKSRAQVQDELRNVTPEQKQQWHELYGRN